MSVTNLIKPQKLVAGDKVAIVSPSWAGASVFPQRYKAGIKQLEEEFGLVAVEAPNSMIDAEENADNPQKRAQDINWAVKNKEIKAIIPVIGGDDAVRILPYLDYTAIRENPKILLGYSDITVLHLAFLHAGVSSIYGPAIMAGGFAENGGMFDYFKNSVRKTLFSNDIIGKIEPNLSGWTDEELSWREPKNQLLKRKLKKSTGNRVLQGKGKVCGHLFGGCVEVLEMLKGTPVWPDKEFFEGAILFLETSEEAPSADYVVRVLRNYAASGVLERVNGIIVGRGANLPENEQDRYDKAFMQVVQKECHLDIPLISQMDFGHTDPMFLLPYGAKAEIDAEKGSFAILENAVI
ncbi:MAG: LD-carboxypeptidase [Alphaproteobacteria bacterium]|nr:LD-carboxypeptidase [Alphaproteobacteria bacterium]